MRQSLWITKPLIPAEIAGFGLWMPLGNTFSCDEILSTCQSKPFCQSRASVIAAPIDHPSETSPWTGLIRANLPFSEIQFAIYISDCNNGGWLPLNPTDTSPLCWTGRFLQLVRIICYIFLGWGGGDPTCCRNKWPYFYQNLNYH